jgi:hypothetical protein
MILIALMLLVGPTVCLARVYFRDHGLPRGRRPHWLDWRVPALMLLLGQVYAVSVGHWAVILQGQFFPMRGLLFFMVSGLAYGAAIFPQTVARRPAGWSERVAFDSRWLVAVPAWLGIAVSVVVTVTLGLG